MAIGSDQRKALSDLKKLTMAEQIGASKYLFMSLLMLFHVIQCRVLTVSEITSAKPPHQPKSSIRIDLVHRDSLISPLSPGNISSTERWKRAVERSNERLQKFQLDSRSYSDKVSDIKDPEAPVSFNTGEYFMKLSIGTPAISYSAILDTGSDLTWTQCTSHTTQTFDPSKSSSYKTVPCSSSLCTSLPSIYCSNSSLCMYDHYSYGDKSWTSGILSYETFILTAEKLPNIAFGCAENNQGSGVSQAAGGLIGFGWGPLSFISQIGPSVGNKFSYCLVSTTSNPPSKTSSLIIGSAAGLNGKTFGSTPLVKGSMYEAYYYLSLEGISVGNKALDIPAGTFDLDPNGSGGIIIDSGSPLTYLEQSGYDAVKQGLLSAVSLPQADGFSVGLDLCYTSAAADFPNITFHFQGADYVLAKENYLYHDSTGVVCLAMLPNSGLSIFGNFQQQNFHILYDLDSSTLSFAPEVCDSL